MVKNYPGNLINCTVFGFGLFSAVVYACFALEDGYKEFLLALFWDLSHLISLSLRCRWGVLSLGSSRCARGQGCVSEGPKQMEKQADRTITENSKDEWKVLHLRQNNHLQGVQAVNTTHKSAMYPGIPGECSQQLEQSDCSPLLSV